MGVITLNRNQKICALCKYWNGVIGSTTIQIVPGGMMFRLDNNEKQSCFKPGRGMAMSALQTCPYFRPRYDD